MEADLAALEAAAGAASMALKTWLRRIRGALGMGVAWAAGWALVGGLIEAADNVAPALFPWTRAVDMWIQTLAIPGFLAGAVFATVLGIAERRRGFDDLSLPRTAAWGAVGGALLGGLAVAGGMASAVVDPLWLRAAVVIAPVAALSAASASGTLALARVADEPELLE